MPRTGRLETKSLENASYVCSADLLVLFGPLYVSVRVLDQKLMRLARAEVGVSDAHQFSHFRLACSDDVGERSEYHVIILRR